MIKLYMFDVCTNDQLAPVSIKCNSTWLRSFLVMSKRWCYLYV